MKIQLLSVGKPRDGTACQLHDRYAERVRQLGVPWEAPWVPECRVGSRYSDDHVREREARALLSRIQPKDQMIALDPAGELRDTERLARDLHSWCRPRGIFVIGGPTGLHESVLQRANHVWSLSPLTFPHELARVLVAEQLYRALSIIRGLPYHKS